MSIPTEIKEIKLTPTERYKFAKNNLTRSIVSKRISYGMKRENLFEPRMNNRKLKLDGKEVTDDMLKIIHKNELSIDRVKQRLYYGWTLERAINTPVNKKKNPNYEGDKYEHDDTELKKKMKKSEIIEVIGRIKYLNNQPKTIVPYVIPLGLKRRAKEYGIDISTIKELEV